MATAVEPLLLGYTQLQQKLGLSRSSIERMVRAGTFPKPFKPTPNRRAWRVRDIEAWLATSGQGLRESAVLNIEDLEPDQLEPRIQQLAATLHAKRTGKQADPKRFTLNPIVDENALLAAHNRAYELQANALASLPIDDAALIVAVLLPQLRPAFSTVADPACLEVADDDQAVAEHAIMIRQFLAMFELFTRLTEQGLTLPDGQSVDERLASFAPVRATILAASLFPALKPLFAEFEITDLDASIFENEDELSRLAMAALHDQQWELASAQNGAQASASGSLAALIAVGAGQRCVAGSMRQRKRGYRQPGRVGGQEAAQRSAAPARVSLPASPGGHDHCSGNRPT